MTNHLVHETSPYLLQHAENPVNWYAWGDEAFEKAKLENKPIFLSIGYSTCHWCHVMAHESFEDDEVAGLLNSGFVSIKVDKEERPDIDSVYMSVCQAMTGGGGWPLTVIMTPDGKPFFSGTYFPKHSHPQIAGLVDILSLIAEKWENEREKLIDSGNEIARILAKPTEKDDMMYTKESAGATAAQLGSMFDAQNGGFTEKPKFPTPQNLLFLMRYAALSGKYDALAMAEKTLVQMYRGGIWDQIGFGFARYSTDERWLVPHFEKMLYDNALMLMAYAEAYQITKKPLYKTVGESIFTYLMRNMHDPEGGFCCAQDADSEGEEGKYYVFSKDELLNLLGKDDGDRFCAFYGITKNGNFEGKNIPNLLGNALYDEIPAEIAAMRDAVLAYRSGRMALGKDDKMLTSWNGLAIVGLSAAGRIFGNAEMLEAAKHAWNFLREKAMDENGRLSVSYRNGTAKGTGHLDDYAYCIWGLLELYAASFDARYLKDAMLLCNVMTNEFFDETNGGFWLYARDAEQLFLRPKDVYDGAMPSGNSVAAYVLQRLAAISADADMLHRIEKQLGFLAREIAESPAGYCFASMVCMLEAYPSEELICVIENEKSKQELAELLGSLFLPNLTILVSDKMNASALNSLFGYLMNYPHGGRDAYYLCSGHVCNAPMAEIAQVKKALDKSDR